MTGIEQDRSEITQIVKEMLSSAGLSGFMTDTHGRVIFTQFTDVETEVAFYKCITAEEISDIRNSFLDYDVTDVTDRESGGFLLRVIAVRKDDGRLSDFLFLIAKKGEGDRQLDSITRILRSTLGLIRSAESRLIEACDKDQKGQEDIGRLNRTRKYYKYLSLCVDDMSQAVSFKDALEDIIKKASFCTDFDYAAVISSDKDNISTVYEYAGESVKGRHLFNDTTKAELPFFNGKIYTISSDSLISQGFKTFMDRLGITAGIFMPLADNMYLCMVSFSDGRIWNSDDIDFVKRDGILLRAKHTAESLTSLLHGADDFMKAFYDKAGFGAAIYRHDTRELIYRNSAADEIFSDPMNEELFRRRFIEADTMPESGEFSSQGDGNVYLVSVTGAVWQDGTDVDVYTITDITRQKQYQKKIRESADLDDLTGLYNRHRFHLDFETAINDAARIKGKGTLIFVDLDDFNALNDGLGHVLADRFLKKAARSVQQVVKKDAQCYRVGGDQFAVLVPYSGYDNVSQITDNIRKRFEKPFSLDGNDYYCTACLGVVHFPQDGDNEDILLKRVDYALHEAKKHGKNKIEVFSEVAKQMPQDRMGIEKALREAVADDCREFEVYYQPVVDIRGGEPHCCGAEALVRWNSKKLGFMTPDKFISLAEYLGLIIPIDEHVLIEAARHCRYWNDYGHPEYRINVNLSVVQLLQNDIVDVIANAIRITGINPDNLVLEVTEGMAINDMDRMKDVLTRIKDLGCRLALDDFGTGYSSLSRLKDFPLDEIKIDRCFVHDIDKDNFSDAFVRSVSQLADAINMNVVVEGVERAPQQDKLENMNVAMIQGFLYDRPLPQDEFDKKYLK